MQIIQVKIRQKNKDEADVYWNEFYVQDSLI